MKIKNIKEFRKYSLPIDKQTTVERDDSNVSGTTTGATVNNELSTSPKFIEGYAAVFNQPSKLLAEIDNGELIVFYEVLRSTAFDRVLNAPDLDCIYCVDHSAKSNKLIARTTAKTLTLNVDEYGLLFSSQIPNTTMARDLVEHINLKNLSENSFCFTVDADDEEWVQNPDGSMTRYINYVSGLYDVSTVITPAYNNTTLSLRGLEILKSKKEDVKQDEKPVEQPNELDLIDLEIELMK